MCAVSREGGINRTILSGGHWLGWCLGGHDTRVAFTLLGRFSHHQDSLSHSRSLVHLLTQTCALGKPPVIPSVVVAVLCTSLALDSSTSTLPLPYNGWYVSISPPSHLSFPSVPQRLITQQTDSDTYRPRESVSIQLPVLSLSLFMCCDRWHWW